MMTIAQTPHLDVSQDNLQPQTKAKSRTTTNHLEELEVGGYRGLGKLSIKNIAKINLIVGKNASGKTSLLEAIWLFYNREDMHNPLICKEID